MKEEDLLTPEMLMDMYQNDRGYASYYAPPTNATPEEKALCELGAAKDLIKSHKELEINPPYINPQNFGQSTYWKEKEQLPGLRRPTS